MSIPVARKIRNLRRRFGIAAPRVVVRPRYACWWLGGACLLVCLCVLAWVILSRVDGGSYDEEVSDLRERLRLQREDLIGLQSVAGTGQNQVRMEQSSKLSLQARAEALERENALLKEDVRLFERLYADSSEAGGLRVESVRLRTDQDGRYHYRLMLSFRPSGQIRDFHGRLEYRVFSQQDGKIEDVSSLVEAGAELRVEVKNFLRREGVFVLPEGGRLKSFEVRVLQGDTLKARSLAQI